ncbi:protein tyrosine phosphatase [Rhodoferax lacus]|uniref:Protein tyrosine phosphatase n=1 Tax=Rhodoferax lacus TaxID=2184758 RepID=A0A3E1RAU1_9BURK|nr:low molecular weight phosphatase family protein [Rhodoferax lacus]RFO95770.1 protein tyrosine phosphatase [Rhodoferax lacus]
MHRSLTNVLFVSETNACRSLLAEACLRNIGKNRFKVFSCGVPGKVAEAPSSWTLLALQTTGIPSKDLRCKPWTEFTRNGAPRMDFVISLDASTAGDHPMWPGQPETALWDYPALVQKKGKGAELGLATVQTLVSLRRRLELLVSLHSKGHTRSELRHDLRDLSYV